MQLKQADRTKRYNGGLKRLEESNDFSMGFDRSTSVQLLMENVPHCDWSTRDLVELGSLVFLVDHRGLADKSTVLLCTLYLLVVLECPAWVHVAVAGCGSCVTHAGGDAQSGGAHGSAQPAAPVSSFADFGSDTTPQPCASPFGPLLCG